jgi:hypothetical protein
MPSPTNLGPITTPELNTQFFVGSVLYPSIQSAITAASALSVGAQVIIPYGVTPTDTIATAAGSANIMLVDGRGIQTAYYTWSGSAYVLYVPSTINAGTAFQVAGTALASTNLSDSASLARLSSNITGTAANITGTVAIANGGTGATTAAAAVTALGALPLTGGTLTGPLTLPSTTPTGYQAVSQSYLAATLTAAGSLPTATAAGQFPASTGATNTYAARALVSADIPNNAANTTGTAANITGTAAIANGGTGATTAAAALTALGALAAAGGAMSGTFSGNPTFSGAPVFSGTVNFTGASPITINGSALMGIAVTAASATPVFNGAGGTVFPYTLAQNVTSSTTSNLVPGEIYIFEIIQATGGTQYSFTWPATMLSTSPISQTAGQKTVQAAVCLTGGSLLCLGPAVYI